jgi:hypothetical protein
MSGYDVPSMTEEGEDIRKTYQDYLDNAYDVLKEEMDLAKRLKSDHHVNPHQNDCFLDLNVSIRR